MRERWGGDFLAHDGAAEASAPIEATHVTDAKEVTEVTKATKVTEATKATKTAEAGI